MATIISYTDISQSRKLAEILPLESADMRYGYTAYDGGYDEIPYQKDFLIKNPNYSSDEYDAELPCWSLAALLTVLPNSIYDNTDEYSQLEFSKISVAYHDMNDGIKVCSIKDNLVDACVAMIEKLYERKLLVL